jgi:hypothetical protein
LAALLLAGGLAANAGEMAIDVAPVWAGHPVGFALLTHGDKQYAAFYDAGRKLTVASRELSETKWHFVVLPETLGWDSHNYIAMAMDDDGCFHLCANMHVKPLVYFRTAKPGDIDTFHRRRSMVGRNEIKCTYPQFLRGPGKEFIFTYRDGSSGSGDQYYNVYDTKSKTWGRLMEEPLTSGEGDMNAYLGPLRLGPDGFYHLAWIWRDTGGCETNHDISYARSKDWVHWEKSSGQPLKLPITLAKADVADPVPPKGGAINGNVTVGFDSQKRVIVSYIKYDDKGFTQVYNARLEDGRWKIYKISSWDYRWDFGGNGSIVFEVHVSPVSVSSDGRLTQAYSNVKCGSGVWILDAASMKVVEDKRSPQPTPAPVVVSDSATKLESRTCGDSGSSGRPGVRYMLRWETLGLNRDRKREGTPPPPSMLRLVRVEP